MNYPPKSIKGFTLVELSIVIVIIGLIIAGVTSGKSLVKQSQLRNILTQVDAIKASFVAFKLQYNAVAGDMANAQTFWPTCTDDQSNLCNGNGNGKLEWWNTNGEGLRAYQHLNLANLLPGNYTGTGGANGRYATPGTNVPALALASGGTYTESFTGTYQLKTNIGKYRTNDPPYNSLLTQSEAQGIDQKIDDGLPTTGKANGWDGGDTPSPTCVNGNTYRTNANNIACAMNFHF